MTDRDTINIDELGYTFNFFPDLSPSSLRLAALFAGYRSESAPLTYLELGFGQGLSLNIHAAASDGEFWGNDYNPQQVAYASQFAAASGANLKLLEDSFAELAARNDVPQFNVIALHGIWTWISSEDRAVIVDLARRKLAPGGLFYVSHNCLAGWAAMTPLRKLMLTHAQRAGVDGAPLTKKVRDAFDFVQTLHAADAKYLRNNPIVAAQMQAFGKKSSTYLAHEFFSHNWQPTAFSDIATQMAEADLSFVASTFLLDAVEALSIGEAGRQILDSIADPILRESAREYLTGTSFRKDLFVKAPAARLDPAAWEAELLKQRFALSAPVGSVPMEATSSTGKIKLDARHFQPILEALASDNHAPKSLAQLRDANVFEARSVREMANEMAALLSGPVVHAVNVTAPPASSFEHCRALNRRICQSVAEGGEERAVASAVTGGGLPLGDLEALFLGAVFEGESSAQALALAARNNLQKRGLVAAADDVTLAELEKRALDFIERRLPILQTLGAA